MILIHKLFQLSSRSFVKVPKYSIVISDILGVFVEKIESVKTSRAALFANARRVNDIANIRVKNWAF